MNEIPRIALPPRERFYDEWVFSQRPVVVTDLFAGEPIRAIDSPEQARAQLGDMPVLYQQPTDDEFTGHIESFLASATREGTEPPPPVESTVAAFLELLLANPGTRLICPEVPPRLLERLEQFYRVPDFCGPVEGSKPDFNWSLWLGNAGYQTQLHYDGDYRSILQYQLFGAKRVILIPPSSSSRLAPIINESLVTADGLKGEALESFLNYLGGYMTTVRTGEAILIPSCYWHYFDYEQVSMSLSLRFGWNERLRFMARHLHNDRFLQSLACRVLNPRTVDAQAKADFEAIKAEWARPEADPIAKAESIYALAREQHLRWAKDMEAARYMRPALESFERAVRADVVRISKLYMPGEKSTFEYEGGDKFAAVS